MFAFGLGVSFLLLLFFLQIREKSRRWHARAVLFLSHSNHLWFSGNRRVCLVPRVGFEMDMGITLGRVFLFSSPRMKTLPLVGVWTSVTTGDSKRSGASHDLEQPKSGS